MAATPESEDDEGNSAPAPSAPPVTAPRFVAAFFLAGALFIVLAVLFTGLGPLGLAPAIVVATVVAGRATKIQRTRVLVVLGVLTFAVMVVVPYAIVIATYVPRPPAGG